MAVSQSLTLTQTGQNVAGNYSKVRILWKSTQTGESWNGYTRTAKYYVSINGGAETEYSVSYTLPKGTTQTILDAEITVNHKADGSGTVKVRTWMDTDISAGVVTQTETLTLTTIPRATTPTLSATVADMGSQITISTPRASSSFTHDLSYRLGEGSYKTIAIGVGTSYKWTIPDLTTSLPNDPSGVITIRCITKNGSDEIGTKVAAFTARVPASVVPTLDVGITEATEGLAEQFEAFIQSKSRLAVTIAAGGVKGSTIKSYKSVLGGNVYDTAKFTTGTLSTSGTIKLVVTVTDSRDRQTTQELLVDVLEYTPPQIQGFTAYRCDSTGAPVDDGEYIAVQYSYSAPELNGGNTAQMQVGYKRAADENYSGLLTGTALSADTTAKPTSKTFSGDYSYEIRMAVRDYFGAEAIAITQLPSAEVILDIGADGESLAVGGTAEHPGFTTKWPQLASGGFTPQPLANAKDLDTLLIPNTYCGKAWNGYINCPAPDRDFSLEVLPAGADGQLMQRLTTCVPLAPVTYTRFYVSGAWQAWFISGFESIWQAATLSGGFNLYAAGQPVQYRRSGGVVELRGVIKPASTIAAGSDWVTITTLPVGYRPGGLNEVNQICQGGGACLWLLRVTTGGAVQLARYRAGADWEAATTSDRLPFSVIFLADR